MAKKQKQQEGNLQNQLNEFRDYKEENIKILKKKTIKELIAPSGIDASNIDHLEIISNTKRYARSFFVSSLPRMATFPELFRDMYMYGDIKEHSIFLKLLMQQKMMEQMLMVKK